MTNLVEFYGEPIHAYSRAEALRDGVLVSVTKTAAEAGFTIPVAMTARAYADAVAWDGEKESLGALQDEPGRLWDVVWMASLGARRNRGTDRFRFQLHRVPRGSRKGHAQLIELEAVCGPGDDFEPVITIQFPGED